MEKLLFIISFSILYFSSLILVLKKENNQIINCTYNIILFSFALIFSFLFPINYYLSIKGFNIDLYIDYYKNYKYFEIVLYYISIFASTHAFLFVARKKNILTKKLFDKNKDDINIQSESSDKKIMIVGIIMLIIGIISNYLYLKVYGGYKNYLNYSSLIRSGIITIKNPFSFLIAFRNFIIFSSYIFLSMIYTNKNKISRYFLFFLSFIFSLFILYSNKGRISFAIYILVLLGYAFLRKKNVEYINIKTLTKVCLVGIVFLIGIVNVGKILGRNTDGNFLMQLNKEFSFIFLNFKVIFNNLKIENYRLLKDLILFPIYLLPNSIWYGKFNILKCSDINTMFWFGSIKGVGSVYGEMPVDFISISYMQFGFAGIIILPIFYAILFDIVMQSIYKIHNVETFKIIYIYVLLTIGIETIIYADPYHIMTSSFAFIAFMILLFVFNKIKIK